MVKKRVAKEEVESFDGEYGERSQKKVKRRGSIIRSVTRTIMIRALAQRRNAMASKLAMTNLRRGSNAVKISTTHPIHR